MKQLFILGIALALVCAAQAYPTLTGPTGLVTLPDAAIAPAGQLSVAADWYSQDFDGILGEAIPIRALYGVGDTFEIGALLWMQDDNDAFGVNAKYLTPLTFGNMAWAAGGQFLSFDDADANVTQLYFAGTRDFTEAIEGMAGISGTIGVNWTNVEGPSFPLSTSQAFRVPGVDNSAFRFYLALQVLLMNNLLLMAEYQTEESDLGETDPVMSLGARYSFTESLTGQIGITNGVGTLGWDDKKLFAGVSYAFGMGASDDDGQY
jgi:hypothetical protein